MDDELNPIPRPATDTDIEVMVALFKAAFERWPAIDLEVPASEHLYWKMRSHPRAEQVNTVVSIDGEIIGAIVQFCHEVKVGSELLVAHSGSDSAIHPRYQGQGLLRKIEPYAKEHVRSSFDLTLITESNHPGIQQRSARRGEHLPVANRLSTLVRTLDLRTFVGVHRARGGLRHLAGAAASALGRFRRRASVDEAGVEISTISNFDDRFEHLWDVASEAFDFVPDRRAAFLNWRYCDQRGGASLVRVATVGDEVRGYSVLKSAGDEALLADLFAVPGDSGVVAALLRDSVARSRERGMRLLKCALPTHHPYRAMLSDAGFIDLGEDARVQYRPHDRHRERLAFLSEDPFASVHLTLGDFDYV